MRSAGPAEIRMVTHQRSGLAGCRHARVLIGPESRKVTVRPPFLLLRQMRVGYLLLLVERCGEVTLKAYPGAPFSMRGASVVILSLSGNNTPNALVSFADP